MVTITRFVKEIKQPRGGYFNKPLKYQFSENKFIESKNEVLSPNTIGTMVDYLTRFIFFENSDVNKILQPVVKGAELINRYHDDLIGYQVIDELIHTKRELNNNVVNNMLKASFISDVYRSGRFEGYKNVKEYQEIVLSDYQHISEMFERCLNFMDILKAQSEIIESDFLVSSDKENSLWGDGDIINNNVIVDFKVYSRNPWNKNNSLQLALYYLLGKNGISNSKINFNKVNYLVLFDVRHNIINYIDINDFSNELDEIQAKIEAWNSKF